MKPHQHAILQLCCKFLIQQHARDLAAGTGRTPAKHPGLVLDNGKC